VSGWVSEPVGGVYMWVDDAVVVGRSEERRKSSLRLRASAVWKERLFGMSKAGYGWNPTLTQRVRTGKVIELVKHERKTRLNNVCE
jgi:hypothetical protein